MRSNINPRKLINILVGITFFVLIFWWLTGFGIVTQFLAPKVESGQLGAGAANGLASAAEVVLAIFGAVLMFWLRVGVFITSKITESIIDLFPTDNAVERKEAFIQKEVERDMYNLLGEMVERKNANMVVELINELAGIRLVEPSSQVPVASNPNLPKEWVEKVESE